MKVKQPKTIYPTGFEIIDQNRQEEQEKGIDEVIAKGYMPIFIFNDDSSNTKNFIPTKFKENIENHPIYFAWIDMLMQKYDSGHPNYGTTIITIEKKWIGSFEQFAKDMKISSNML
jgi:hypothetical protein